MGENRSEPGFRFHPTDEELVVYYLKKKILGEKLSSSEIAEVDIYKHAPWDLPGMSCSKSGDLKWFFFCPTDKKYSRGRRVNRATEYGYWKTTGDDRPVMHKVRVRVVGKIKTLIFHRGKPPGGDRTNWVLHEYRLEDKDLADRGVVQDTYVLCVVFEKDGKGPRNGAQYGAPYKEKDCNGDEELNLRGTDSFVSTLAAGGASSSYVPESLCAGPSVESNGLYALLVGAPQVPVAGALPVVVAAPQVPFAGAPLLPNGLYALLVGAPQVPVAGGLPVVVGASQVPVAGALPVLVGASQVPGAGAPLLPGAPQVPVADAPLLPVVTEANAVPGDAPQLPLVPRAQESNDDISSMLDIFIDDNAVPGEAPQLALVPRAQESNDDISSMLDIFMAPDEDDITPMLASLWELYYPNDILNPFK